MQLTKKFIFVTLLLAALTTNARAQSVATCPSGGAWSVDWYWRCSPSNAQCSFGVWIYYFKVAGRLINKSWYHDWSGTHGGDSWSNVCWDTSPWPTSWTGDYGIWRKDDEPQIIHSWKRETTDSSSSCHCYRSTNGSTWTAEPFCGFIYRTPGDCQ